MASRIAARVAAAARMAGRDAHLHPHRSMSMACEERLSQFCTPQHPHRHQKHAPPCPALLTGLTAQACSARRKRIPLRLERQPPAGEGAGSHEDARARSAGRSAWRPNLLPRPIVQQPADQALLQWEELQSGRRQRAASGGSGGSSGGARGYQQQSAEAGRGAVDVHVWRVSDNGRARAI